MLGYRPSASHSPRAGSTFASSSAIASVALPFIAFGPAAAVFADDPIFTGLGDLEGGTFYSEAHRVAPAGPTVVGYTTTSRDTSTAFRWTLEGGMVGLEGFDDSRSYLRTATAVSADAQVIAGRMTTAFFDRLRAFAWTPDTNVVNLGNLPDGSGDSAALGVSDDGTVIVGYGNYSFDDQGVETAEAFRWTRAGGMVGLGDLSGGEFFSQAHAADADGEVIVGQGTSASGREAFAWTAALGLRGLGVIGGANPESGAFDVSGDGHAIVGYSTTDLGLEAFRKVSNGPMVALGVLPGGTIESVALACSDGGEVVVGWGTTNQGQEAFIWDEAQGMRRLIEVLANEYHLNTSGWTLLSATDITADGKTIVGNGINPDGAREGWIAVLYDVDDEPRLAQTPLHRGQEAQFSVTGAEPGEKVHFLYSTAGTGEGPCPPQLGGLCLDLLKPVTLLGSAITDGAGVANLRRTVPSDTPLIDVSTQAVIRRGPGGADSVKTNTITAPILE